MKITIYLNDAKVKGVKEYLKDTDSVEKPVKNDIQVEIQGIVDGYLEAPQNAVSDYIKKYSR